jgi:hypothetical protein
MHFKPRMNSSPGRPSSSRAPWDSGPPLAVFITLPSVTPSATPATERRAWRQTPYRSAAAQWLRTCERLKEQRLLVRQAAHGSDRAQKGIARAARRVVSGAFQQRRALFRRLHCSSVRQLHHASARGGAARRCGADVSHHYESP